MSASVPHTPAKGHNGEAVVSRAMLGLGLGNTVEWYDWVVFGLLASFIGPQFFEAQDPMSATLDALAVFAIGFVARPLGEPFWATPQTGSAAGSSCCCRSP